MNKEKTALVLGLIRKFYGKGVAERGRTLADFGTALRPLSTQCPCPAWRARSSSGARHKAEFHSKCIAAVAIARHASPAFQRIGCHNLPIKICDWRLRHMQKTTTEFQDNAKFHSHHRLFGGHSFRAGGDHFGRASCRRPTGAGFGRGRSEARRWRSIPEQNWPLVASHHSVSKRRREFSRRHRHRRDNSA